MIMSQDVQEAHKRDIERYYTSLKTFFDVIGVQQLNRETSPRAQKARGKLLKLSFSQFYELSTDVADELTRRINEDQNKPEYLLPKANFHMKRNQARQKLANLSQTRFNELVDDILYEIRRRGFDTYTPRDNSKLAAALEEEEELELENGRLSSSTNVSDSRGAPPPEAHNSTQDSQSLTNRTSGTSNSSQIPATSTSIQPSQVIPKKASIDWSSSSSEGEDMDLEHPTASIGGAAEDLFNSIPESIQENETTVDEALEPNETLLEDEDLNNNNNAFVTPVAKNMKLMDKDDEDLNELLHAQREGGTLQEHLDNTFGSINNPDIDIPTPVLPSFSNNILPPHLTGDDSEPQREVEPEPEKEVEPEPVQEPIPLIETPAETSTELPVEKEQPVPSLTEHIKKVEEANAPVRGSIHTEGTVTPVPSIGATSHRQSEFVNLNMEIRNLSIENENLKQKISMLEMESKFRSKSVGANIDSVQDADLVKPEIITTFTSQDGIIPADLVKTLNTYLKLFHTVIQSSEHENDTALGNNLFNILGQTTGTIAELLTLVDIPTFKDQVMLLKVSLSHLISTVRYYSIYHSLLPKVTIYCAVTELAFALCDVIRVAHIKPSDITNPKKTGKVDSLNSTDISRLTSPQPFAVSANGLSTPNLQNMYMKPSDVNDDMDDIENSPVKPLKITQKLGNQSPSLVPKINTRMRQPSGSGLFSLMIDQERNHSKTPSVNNSTTSVPVVPSSLQKSIPKPQEKTIVNSKPSVTENTLETTDKIEKQPDVPTKPSQEKKEITDNTKPVVVTEEPSAKEENIPQLSQKRASAARSSKDLSMSIDNIFGGDKTNDEELIKHANDDHLNDLNEVPNMHSESKQSLTKFDSSESDENLNKSPAAAIIDSDNDETFMALKKVQETKKIENEKKKRESQQLNADPVESQPSATISNSAPEKKETVAQPKEDNVIPPVVADMKTTLPPPKEENITQPATKSGTHLPPKTNESPSIQKPIKINKLESASLKKVSLNRVNTNSPNPNPSIEIPKRHESRLKDTTEAPMLGLGVKAPSLNAPEKQTNSSTEVKSIQNGKPQADPVVKKEPVEVSIPKVTEPQPEKVSETEPIVKAEEKDIPLPPKETEDPVIKKEISERALPPSDKPSSAKDELMNDEDDEDSSYQFVPLKTENGLPKQSDPPIKKEDETDESDETSESGSESEEEDDFDVDAFDIENPDNTLSDLLLYLEHQTMDVISTIQSLLSSIKEPQSTKGSLRGESNAINQVIGQMVDATSVSMNQSRNANLKEHGSWVVQSLEDCARRMTTLCQLQKDGIVKELKSDTDYADKNFKQRLAGIAFDVAKCTKELVKTVEEASLQEEIEYLNARLH